MNQIKILTTTFQNKQFTLIVKSFWNRGEKSIHAYWSVGQETLSHFYLFSLFLFLSFRHLIYLYICYCCSFCVSILILKTSIFIINVCTFSTRFNNCNVFSLHLFLFLSEHLHLFPFPLYIFYISNRVCVVSADI